MAASWLGQFHGRRTKTHGAPSSKLGVGFPSNYSVTVINPEISALPRQSDMT
jgi:hypothetical protein